MKVFESIVFPTANERRVSTLLLLFIGGWLFMIVGIIEYFVHGNHWGKPDLLVGSLFGIGAVGILIGFIGLRIDNRQGEPKLSVFRDAEGLRFVVTGNDGDQRLLPPIQWTRWQNLRAIGEYDKCIVENIKIQGSNGEWLGFVDSQVDQQTPTVFVDFRNEQLGNDARVYELYGISELIHILQKETKMGTQHGS